MEQEDFKPTKEQQEAVEKARENISKQRIKKSERDYDKWRLSGSRTH